MVRGWIYFPIYFVSFSCLEPVILTWVFWSELAVSAPVWTRQKMNQVEYGVWSFLCRYSPLDLVRVKGVGWGDVGRGVQPPCVLFHHFNLKWIRGFQPRCENAHHWIRSEVRSEDVGCGIVCCLQGRSAAGCTIETGLSCGSYSCQYRPCVYLSRSVITQSLNLRPQLSLIGFWKKKKTSTRWTDWATSLKAELSLCVIIGCK